MGQYRRTRYLAPLFAAFATAAAVAVAPPAEANSNPANCRAKSGGVSCQKQGHSSFRAEPQTRQPPVGLWHPAWLPGYGRGPALPPFIALD